MADKIVFTNDNNPYGIGNSEPARESGWTGGLPKGFTGWGPQTPDPDEPVATVPEPHTELLWRGEDDHHNHYVWHFDGRRHRHH